MRAVLLSFVLVFGFTAVANAAEKNRKIEDFYGVFLGHGTEEPVPGDVPHGDQGKMTRFSQVIIRPEKAERGFSIEWSTLKLEGDELPREADTKTYVQTFRGSDKSTVFRDITSGDPNLGADTAWAVINGDTLSMVQISVAQDGNYYVVHYDRTLTEKGMDVRFTRFENSRVVRAIKLSLLRGPAKVN